MKTAEAEMHAGEAAVLIQPSACCTSEGMEMAHEQLHPFPAVPEEEGRQDALPQPSKQCEMCKEAPAKYCCPGCSFRTCSLSCVQRHKVEHSCTGKRNRLAFVPLAEFRDRELLSDYRLLEEVARADDVAKRCRPPAPKAMLPPALANMVHQAERRRVTLMLMSPGMNRRRNNTTRYDARTRKLKWRVEWVFESAGHHVVDELVAEDTPLIEVLARHLTYKVGLASRQWPLRAYADAGLPALKVYMRKERSPANAPSYYAVDCSRPLGSQLAGKVLVEFPVFVVALPGEESKYPSAFQTRPARVGPAEGRPSGQTAPGAAPPPAGSEKAGEDTEQPGQSDPASSTDPALPIQGGGREGPGPGMGGFAGRWAGGRGGAFTGRGDRGRGSFGSGRGRFAGSGPFRGGVDRGRGGDRGRGRGGRANSSGSFGRGGRGGRGDRGHDQQGAQTSQTSHPQQDPSQPQQQAHPKQQSQQGAPQQEQRDVPQQQQQQQQQGPPQQQQQGHFQQQQGQFQQHQGLSQQHQQGSQSAPGHNIVGGQPQQPPKPRPVRMGPTMIVRPQNVPMQLMQPGPAQWQQAHMAHSQWQAQAWQGGQQGGPPQPEPKRMKLRDANEIEI